MTIENYHYRNSPLFLRNQFLGNGTWQLPNIPKCTLTAEELDGLRLIGYDRAKNGNDEHFQRMVHFFHYDNKFEDVWTDPEKRVEVLRKYRAVLTPDFSMYIEMHPVLQLYNTFRNRWVGAYLANQNLKVVPTVNWGDETTFGFCFEGIAKGSAVAVSTYMASEHNNRKDQKDWFLAGYNEMLRRIEPSVVICYSTPFPEMQGNIVHVDYELSSWKHDGDDLGKAAAEPTEGIKIVKHTGYVIFDDFISHKGGGSAHGGGWKPSKAEDERFLGKPGEIIETVTQSGNRYLTKIGEDGRAISERQYTNHGYPKYHSDPHDQEIGWDPNTGFPIWGKQINYDGIIPEFKAYEVSKSMGNIINLRNEPDAFYETISAFKWSIIYGREVGIEYDGKTYGMLRRGDGLDGPFIFYEAYNETSEQSFATVDKLLDCEVDGIRLRKFITKAKIVWRNV